MDIVRLKVLSNYRRQQVAYVVGTIIEVREDEAEFLLRDAPGCFEVVPAGPRVDLPAEEPVVEETPEEPSVGPERKAFKRPPLDKMQRGGEVDKE